MLCDTRNFIGCKHDSKSNQCMGLHRNQSHQEERSLHESREAKRNNLLTPAREAFCHSARKAEEIETAYSDLREKDTTSLDIREEALDYTVSEADYHEQFEQHIVRNTCHCRIEQR